MHLSYGNRLCLYLQDGYRRALVRRVEPRLAAIAADLQPDGRSASDLVSRDTNSGYLGVLFRKIKII